MGKTTTPRYRVEVTCVSSCMSPIIWRVKGLYGTKGYGTPNERNLARFVQMYNDSFAVGGVNEQCGPGSVIVAAKIIDQFSDVTVAEWKA